LFTIKDINTPRKTQAKKIVANPSSEAMSWVFTKFPKKRPNSGKNQEAKSNPTITDAKEMVSRAKPLRMLLTMETARSTKIIQSRKVNSNSKDMSLHPFTWKGEV
jgi:hypothetical protein